MNKRGEEGELLRNETFGTLVAVICIGFLIVAVVTVYFTITGDRDIKKAQAVIDIFANETRRINAGEINNVIRLVPNPSSWRIFNFVGSDKKPNSCAGANCLCVCEKLSIEVFNVEERQAQKCDDKGVCTVIMNLKKSNPIEIKGGGVFVSINKVNGLIEITKK